MSCILNIIGVDLDVDTIIEHNNLEPDMISRKGERAFGKLKRLNKWSCIGFIVSEAGFEQLDKQIKDTINYLNSNVDRFSFIKTEKSIQFANVHLGVTNEFKWVQSFYFPTELLEICSKIGLSIGLSTYDRGADE